MITTNDLFADYSSNRNHLETEKVEQAIEYIEFFYILNGIDLSFNKFKSMTLKDRLEFMKVNNRNNKIDGLLNNE